MIQVNSSSNLLVLGATGQVGRLVAKYLKKKGANFSVGTRKKANLEKLSKQFGLSRYIDLDDRRTFDEALKGVTGLFLLTAYTVDMLVQSKTLIDAARRNGVKHIVHLGAFSREHDSYTSVFVWHQMIEAYIRDRGIASTNLHPNMSCRISSDHGRSKVVCTLHSLPNRLGLPLWKMLQNLAP